MNYFAYGSNMDVMQVARRCPGANVRGPGFIHGFAFRINRYGVATIVPSNRTVHGLVWDITPEHEARLDEYEGVFMGFYSKEQISVRLVDDSQVEALVYVAANSQPGQPRPGYLGLIIEAAKAQAFPPAYLAELQTWQKSQPDPKTAAF